MVIDPDIKKLVETFVELLTRNNIKLTSVYLFGSWARGKAGKWSDIDLALVSENFQGIPFYDRKMINPYILATSSSIEIHPFRPEEFTEDDPFVQEIIRTGVRII